MMDYKWSTVWFARKEQSQLSHLSLAWGDQTRSGGTLKDGGAISSEFSLTGFSLFSVVGFVEGQNQRPPTS